MDGAAIRHMAQLKSHLLAAWTIPIRWGLMHHDLVHRVVVHRVLASRFGCCRIMPQTPLALGRMALLLKNQYLLEEPYKRILPVGGIIDDALARDLEFEVSHRGRQDLVLGTY